MKVVFVIRKPGKGYIEVTKEEYALFDGEKFMASPWWRMMIVQDWLIQLRH